MLALYIEFLGAMVALGSRNVAESPMDTFPKTRSLNTSFAFAYFSQTPGVDIFDPASRK